MRRRRAAAALLLLAVGLLAAGAPRAHAAAWRDPATAPAEWIEVGDPILGEVELLRIAGLADSATVLYTRPLARRTVAALVARARRQHPESRDPSLVRLEREFGRELADYGLPRPARSTPPWLERADAGGTRLRLIPYAAGALAADGDLTAFADRSRAGGRLGIETGGLLAHLDAWVGKVDDAPRFADPLVRGSDFLGYADDVYASWAGRSVDATFGRSRFALGPGGGGSLLWSRQADPVTFLSLGATLFGHVRALAVHADVDATRGARLAAHRLEWFPSPRLTVGVGEAVRYTSPHWEPLYVLSLLPYTWVQRMVAQDALDRTGPASPDRNNVMASIDASWRAWPGTELYGTFLLDDQGLAQGGQPTRIGYQGGVHAARALGTGRGSARLEYTRIYRYVYSVFYGEDFIHHGRAIGDPLGPDSRRVALDLAADPGADWRFTARASRTELGEGGLGEFYDPALGDASGSTLSGVVERTWSAGAGARWWPRDGVDVGVAVGRDWTANAAHVAGADRRRWTAELALRLHR